MTGLAWSLLAVIVALLAALAVLCGACDSVIAENRQLRAERARLLEDHR